MTTKNEQIARSSALSVPVASVLAILALIGGIWLGRVAFVKSDLPTPVVLPVQVMDPASDMDGTVEFFADRDIYLLTLRAVPPPPEGKVYQVWVQTPDVIVSAGLFNPNSRTFAFAAYEGRYDSMFMTLEPGPLGSQQPSSAQLLQIALAP